MKSDQSGILTDQALMHGMEVEEAQNAAFGSEHLIDWSLLWKNIKESFYILGTNEATQPTPAKSEPGIVDPI